MHRRVWSKIGADTDSTTSAAEGSSSSAAAAGDGGIAEGLPAEGAAGDEVEANGAEVAGAASSPAYQDGTEAAHCESLPQDSLGSAADEQVFDRAAAAAAPVIGNPPPPPPPAAPPSCAGPLSAPMPPIHARPSSPSGAGGSSKAQAQGGAAPTREGAEVQAAHAGGGEGSPAASTASLCSSASEMERRALILTRSLGVLLPCLGGRCSSCPPCPWLSPCRPRFYPAQLICTTLLDLRIWNAHVAADNSTRSGKRRRDSDPPADLPA